MPPSASNKNPTLDNEKPKAAKTAKAPKAKVAAAPKSTAAKTTTTRAKATKSAAKAKTEGIVETVEPIVEKVEVIETPAPIKEEKKPLPIEEPTPVVAEKKVSKPAEEEQAPAPAKAAKSTAADDKIIQLKPPIVVKDLATRMAVKPFQLISDLMQMRILVSINQNIEPDVAKKLCEKHGFKLELERRGENVAKPETPREEVKTVAAAPRIGKLIPRAPVVTIMGHVDHGKTSLLDVIRKARVAAGEAGGITQHIGAYSVDIGKKDKNGNPQTITFLDTPGHEAFTAMRVRGANVTDIVILVVAGDDGLMPQTLEAISHARAAKVPIIVALTKMDLDAAQKMKDRAKKQLQEQDLAPEEWGGKTILVEVSATKKMGIDTLLEMIMLQAEIMELKAEEDVPAEGSVIEAQMEAGRGPTATVLVRKGVLRVGDAMIVGPHWGRVRALVDDKGKNVKEAGPSSPVKVIGLSGIPLAGIGFQILKSEVEARQHSEKMQEQQRSEKLEAPKRLTLEDLISSTGDQRKVLKIILKTDVQGSYEAIAQSITKLPQDKINIELIHSGIGPITESDVLLAAASKALIAGFQVKVDNVAAETAKREGVQIQLFRIIYELIDKVREFMGGLLDPEIKLTSVGTAEVKQVFEVSKGGNVAGCLVTQGRIERKGRVRVLRKRNVIFEGSITTLRRFQDDASEVRTGLECGIRIEAFNEFEPGDIIEVYHIEKIAQKL